MAQFDFLTEYVLELLKQNGLGDLTDEQKKTYLPQLLSQVEERIGLELLPKLSDANMEAFAGLAEKETTTPEEWKAFWYAAIPNFEGELQAILTGFTDEVRGILAK